MENVPSPPLEETPAEWWVGVTTVGQDGNRYLPGTGTIPSLEPVDIELPGIPTWVVGVPYDNGALWAVTLEDGSVYAYTVQNGAATPAAITPGAIGAGTPPTLLLDSGGTAMLVSAPVVDASLVTAPAVLPDGAIALITTGGDLVTWRDGAEAARWPVNALPDTRIMVDDRGRVLLLTAPTEFYTHNVLGDAVEANQALMIDPVSGQTLATFTPPGESVFEAISAIWADLDGDGVREVILTASDASNGAQLLVYDDSGQLIAASQPVGLGYRWRNQLAIAPFGPAGTFELVDVRTPHIGGRVEFFTLNGDQLSEQARVEPYTSHVISTRNLDMGIAGDFNGDGIAEVLVAHQSRTLLTGIQRTETNAAEIYNLYLDERLSTNISAVSTTNGLAVAVGMENNMLRIWGP